MSRSTRKKKPKRPPLVIDPKLPRPALVGALAEGVEATARASALRAGHAVAGYVPLATKPPPGCICTTTAYAPQALKWNVKASEASLLISADATLFGRALQARQWSTRYSRPWLQVWPAIFDAARLQEWLRTHAIARLHVTGPASYQAPGLEPFVEQVLQSIWLMRTAEIDLATR
jgi:hypothetical protein